MAQSSIRVGSIENISGEVTIAGGDIYKGFTSEQVSALLTQITSTFQVKKFEGRCPYKGLDVFEEEDAGLFFGREKLVDELVGRVKDSRTVFITGPSGSGKSSLVRAGLIPALKQGAIPKSDGWLYETIKPGRDPLEALASAFSRLKSPELGKYFRENFNQPNTLHECAESALSGRKDQRFVLFIDQFEEVFTQVGKDKAEPFLNLLTHAAAVENGRFIILFAMRSDFVSNCATYPKLNELLNRQFIQIGAMQPDELVSAIAQPALRVGLRIDPDLVAQIINDMRGEPGVLPLMQFALKDLFDSQNATDSMIALTLSGYIQRGGIHKALERHADNAFSKLSASEKELARVIFSGLIEIGRGRQDTRRTALFNELIPANHKAEDLNSAVQKLADSRLIITDEQAGVDTVMISHEKLIDAWPWLKKLINENRDIIALQNEITSDAKEWEGHKHDPSYLYTGARLINAREQMEAKKLSLSGLAQEFVQKGSTRQRRRQVTVVSGVSMVVLLLVFAVILFNNQANTNQIIANTAQAASTYAVEQASVAQAANTLAVAQQLTAEASAQEALTQAKISRTGELAAQSVAKREKDFKTSLLLGIEAFHLLDTVQTRRALLDNTNAILPLLQVLTGHTGSVSSVAFSPNRQFIASGSNDGTIIIWNAITHQPIGQPLSGNSPYVYSVAFSPDTRILASSDLNGNITLWDMATHQPIGQPLTGHTNWVGSVAFSPDGRTIASGSFDGTIILWDVASHQPIGEPLGHTSGVMSVAFSPDGRILASAGFEDNITLWDVATHQLIGRLDIGDYYAWGLAFSPDGRTLAAGTYKGTISMWDITTYQPIGQLTGHTSVVISVAFSPDGQILASVSSDNTIILWDVTTHRPIGQPFSGSTSVSTVAFSPDGQTLASGNQDGTIILWDVSKLLSMSTNKHLPISQLLVGNSSYLYSLAISPDGQTLAVGKGDDTIILWDMITRQPIGKSLNGYAGIGFNLAFSPDGQTLASGSDDGTVILWDVIKQQPIGQPLTGHTQEVTSVAFSPDGKSLASGGHEIWLWDVETGEKIGEVLSGYIGAVSSVAFSPNSKVLASGHQQDAISGNLNNPIILWDVVTHQPIGQPLTGHTNSVSSVVFSPNGKILASGSLDGTIIFWDVATRQPIGQPLTEHTNSVSSVVFSPDGKILASGSWDSTIILWDVTTRQPIGQPLTGHTQEIRSVVFSPDGQTLISGSYSDPYDSLTIDRPLFLWDLNPQSWINLSCQRAGANFTRADWEKYFPGEEYRITCQQWPSGK